MWKGVETEPEKYGSLSLCTILFGAVMWAFGKLYLCTKNFFMFKANPAINFLKKILDGLKIDSVRVILVLQCYNWLFRKFQEEKGWIQVFSKQKELRVG